MPVWPEDHADVEALSAIERAHVRLTMIVRDQETNLANCLASVRGVFDKIIIVDTRSKDQTVEIARSFDAKVFEFAWVDRFSAARNEALSNATRGYAFWLDAHDVVEPREREKLVALLESLRRARGRMLDRAPLRPADNTPTAFVVRCARDPSPDGTGGETVVDHLRLFSRRADIRWSYRVHEQILPALRKTGVRVQVCACNGLT
jgi:glycosyltransferase involved in cell wall biosynthesis